MMIIYGYHIALILTKKLGVLIPVIKALTSFGTFFYRHLHF